MQKKIGKSLRQHGLLSTIKKIKNRLKYLGFSNHYSSVPRDYSKVPRVSVSDRNYAIDTLKDKSPIYRTLISMIKNEKDIIETFASHALAMFDRVIFVDHRSTDGTGQYLKLLASTHPQVEYFLFDEPGYYQSEVMTWVVKNIVGPLYNGWIFFLDADEYLPHASRSTLDKELAGYASFPVISMPWQNLVPIDMETGQVQGGHFLKPSKTAIHCKIAFQPSLIAVDEYVVAQGNHALMIGEAHQQVLPAQAAFPIFHIPIRTKQQLRDKIKTGVESYKKMGIDRLNIQGFHWDEISRLIEINDITDDLLVDMVTRYGEQLKPTYGKSMKVIIQEGYSEIKLDICTIKQIASFDEINFNHNVESSILTTTNKEEKQVPKRSLPIELEDRSVLRFKLG